MILSISFCKLKRLSVVIPEATAVTRLQGARGAMGIPKSVPLAPE